RRGDAGRGREGRPSRGADDDGGGGRAAPGGPCGRGGLGRLHPHRPRGHGPAGSHGMPARQLRLPRRLAGRARDLHGRGLRDHRLRAREEMIMRLGRIGIAFTATLALASPAPAAQTIGPDLHSWARKPEIAAALTVLDAWIAATVAQREQPGLSIGIVYDQDLVWTKAYGFADVARRLPATPSTLYRIASISKLFTSTAIMQLRDAVKLRL